MVHCSGLLSFGCRLSCIRRNLWIKPLIIICISFASSFKLFSCSFFLFCWWIIWFYWLNRVCSTLQLWWHTFRVLSGGNQKFRILWSRRQGYRTRQRSAQLTTLTLQVLDFDQLFLRKIQNLGWVFLSLFWLLPWIKILHWKEQNTILYGHLGVESQAHVLSRVRRTPPAQGPRQL